jgi:protein gp37
VAENSKIEWTDHTWNPWIGCTKVGPPCDNCYAEAMMATRYGRVEWGAGKSRSRTSAGNWKLPYRWDKAPIPADLLVRQFPARLARAA